MTVIRNEIPQCIIQLYDTAAILTARTGVPVKTLPTFQINKFHLQCKFLLVLPSLDPGGTKEVTNKDPPKEQDVNPLPSMGTFQVVLKR